MSEPRPEHRPRRRRTRHTPSVHGMNSRRSVSRRKRIAPHTSTPWSPLRSEDGNIDLVVNDAGGQGHTPSHRGGDVTEERAVAHHRGELTRPDQHPGLGGLDIRPGEHGPDSVKRMLQVAGTQPRSRHANGYRLRHREVVAKLRRKTGSSHPGTLAHLPNDAPTLSTPRVAQRRRPPRASVVSNGACKARIPTSRADSSCATRPARRAVSA